MIWAERTGVVVNSGPPFGVAGWQAVAVVVALVGYVALIIGGLWFWACLVWSLGVWLLGL